MSEECTHDCSTCGSSCEHVDAKDLIAPLNKDSSIKHVYAIMSGKGGVGKSSTTASLATAMAKRGYKVGIMDADITGPSIPTAFGLDTRAVGDGESIFPELTPGGIKIISLNLLLENKGDPVVWRGSLLGGVVKQFWTDVRWGELDYLFIDMPPGTGDVPLTVFQSIPVDAVYASDLRRTQITARAAARPRGLEVHIEPGLREIGMGVYEDRTFGDLHFHFPEEQKRFVTCSPDWAPEGGETFTQVGARVTDAVFRIARAHPDQTVAVFTHGTATRCLQSALRNKHPSQTPELGHCENTGVTCLEFEGDQVRILFENDASHLPEEIATVARQRRAMERGAPLLAAWFRPLDMDREAQIYYEARKDAWQDIHGSMADFDGPGFLAEAREQWLIDRRAVECVMAGDRVIGVLQLATDRFAAEKVGYVPLVYLQPEYRRRGIGVQLIGQAVCTYRALGRERLRLRCAPDNLLAQRFYKRYGFVRIGPAPGARVPLDLLEKSI